MDDRLRVEASHEVERKMLVYHMRTHDLDDGWDLSDLMEEYIYHPWLSLSDTASEEDIGTDIDHEEHEDESDDRYENWIHTYEYIDVVTEIKQTICKKWEIDILMLILNLNAFQVSSSCGSWRTGSESEQNLDSVHYDTTEW